MRGRWQEGAGSVQRGLRFFFRFLGFLGLPWRDVGGHTHAGVQGHWHLSSPWPLGPQWGAGLPALSSWLPAPVALASLLWELPHYLHLRAFARPVPPGPSLAGLKLPPHCLQVSPLRKGTSSERPSLITSHKIATLHGPLLLFSFFPSEHCPLFYFIFTMSFQVRL